jgi:hypothetical protein
MILLKGPETLCFWAFVLYVIFYYGQPLSSLDCASLLGMQLPDGTVAGTYLIRLGSLKAFSIKATILPISVSVRPSGLN